VLETPPEPTQLKVVEAGNQKGHWFSIVSPIEVLYVMPGFTESPAGAKGRGDRWLQRYRNSGIKDRRTMLGWKAVEQPRGRSGKRLKGKHLKGRHKT